MPCFDLDAIDPRSLPVNLVNEKLIRKFNALPLLKRGKTLFIGISDPTDPHGLDDIKFQSLLNLETVLVEESKLLKTIETALDSVDTTMSDLMDADLDNLNITGGEEDPAKSDANSDIDDAPIVRFVNKILLGRHQKRGFRHPSGTLRKNFRIRYRSDGMLHQVASPPANISNRIISRIKVMSKMDIAERRVPQDGRIKMILSKTRAIDFRVNTCPTLFGEKVVLRILDPTSAQLGIERLGFEPEQQALFLKAIHKPYGMVLVTGPTGSGKTVSLYTGLNILNKMESNIFHSRRPCGNYRGRH